MGRLEPDYTPAFSRDVKRLAKKHVDLAPLEKVIELVCANDAASLEILKSRHNMHILKGNWLGSHIGYHCSHDSLLVRFAPLLLTSEVAAPEFLPADKISV